MGAARTVPDPKFEENLKEIGNLQKIKEEWIRHYSIDWRIRC